MSAGAPTDPYTVTMDRGTESILHRLADEALAEYELRRRLAAVTRRRNLLIVKARRAGVSLRGVESFANVSNPRVAQIANEYEASHG